MFHEVDQALRSFLFAELKSVTDGLIQDESQIEVGSAELPGDREPGKPKILLFLHDVHENLAVRDQSFEVQRTENPYEVGKSRKPTRVNLSFMLTVTANDALTEHRVLGEALGVLLRNSYIPEKHLTGSLSEYGEGAVSLSVAQKDQWAHMDAPNVWQATRQPLRPFLGIVASVVFDPFETKTVKLVREALLAVGQGVRLEGAERQMELRSVRLSAAGVVTNAAGDGLADARVTVAERNEEALTNEKGVFLLTSLPPGSHTLRVDKAGYRSQELEVEAPRRGLASDLVPLTIQLSAESDEDRVTGKDPASLVGTLRYGDGRPAAFIPVRVGDRTAVTDQLGGYVFTGIGQAPVEILAEVPGLGERPVQQKGSKARIS